MSWEGTPWHAFSERVWAALEAGMDDEVFERFAMELFALQAKEGSPGLMKALGLLAITRRTSGVSASTRPYSKLSSRLEGIFVGMVHCLSRYRKPHAEPVEV